MKSIHPIKAAITLALLAGSWHLCWSVLVALGWAQAIINFIFWIHFVQPIYVIQPFNLGLAAGLVVFTSAIAFVIGLIFATLWNRLHLE
jgi:hypothetical protein